MSASDPGAELVDVLDDAGRTIGRTTRREMRARRLPHRSVYVLVMNRRGEPFVHLRTATKDVYPSHWDAAVGGVLAAGESFAEGARRELAEELGVEAPLTELFPLRWEDDATVVHGMVYAATHEGPFRLQPEEIVEGRFVSWRELDHLATTAPVCPDSLRAVAEYRRRRAATDPADAGPAAIPIADAGDPRLAEFAGLRDPALRRAGLFVAESRPVVEELLRAARHRVRAVLATEDAYRALRGALAGTATPPAVFVAGLAVVQRVTGYAFHRGCVAVAERAPDVPLPALLHGAGPGPAMLLALDEVTNPDNVGALFRNAAAFGARAVILSPGSGDPLYRKTVRVSMGAALRVPFVRPAPWPDALAAVREAGFTLVALTPRGDDIDRFVPPAHGRLALVVGAEDAGVPAATLARVEAAVRIPMRPGIDSLNVSVAAGIALHRLARVSETRA